MDLEKRFLKYVSFDTQSDENSSSTPSTLKQLDLAKYLVKELKSIGCSDAFLDEYGIVYASIKANVNKKIPTIGLIAHMDTSSDCSGANIHPRIIRNYDGSKIMLNENTFLDPSEFVELNEQIHDDLIVTDGTTLLGADDKAGIAIIVESIYRIINDKNHLHGDIKIAFTPDEEIGRGTEHFDVEFFDCDYAYTLDGGDIHIIEYENFNAASAIVEIKGINIHPGSAKDKMINSILLAKEFDDLLPKDELPSNTFKYQGFHHLCDINGDVEHTTLHYIIRNHDANILKRQMNDFVTAKEKIDDKYHGNFVSLTLKEGYKNMKEVIEKHYEVIDKVTDAYKKLNIDYRFEPIRGGTDGANLSFLNLPCPNLGDGGYNFHGRYEYANLTQMRQMVKIVQEIARVKDL
ncbi:MAG: peptidase T [Erysipelotrichaceae bacterium]|nr:peptidase T [Erysipelotrichaceae bacterium]